MNKAKGCVFIYYVQSDGLSWANYLQSKLHEKEYSIMSTLVDINNIQDDFIPPDVNIVLVSPDMCTSPSLKALNKFQTDHSLAVLLGVERSEYLQIVNVQEGQSLRKWQIFNTQANEHSVRGLLMKIIELYETVHNDDVELDDPYDFLPDPKPVLPSRTVGQKQVSEKEKENEKYFDDFTVTCSIESPEDEKQYDNPISNKLLATLIPYTGAERCAFLLLDNKPVGKVKIITDCNEEIEAERVRKTLYKVTLKDEIKFSVVEDDRVLGSSAINFNASKDNNSSEASLSHETETSNSSELDKIREMLLKQTDPVCMLCKALRLERETADALDDFLAERCKNLRSLRSLQKIFNSDDQNVTGSSSADQWPTLLHFGAEFNLIKFCKELLNLPRSLESCNIMNNAKEIPFDIAQHKNYRELADMLEQYMEQQWQCNDPGNKDSGIEPDTPMPHGSGYMAMNPDMAPTVPQHLPVLHRESTYIEMDKIHVGDDDSDNGEYIFGDDEPSEPPTPHMIKYVNTEIKEAQTNVIPDIVFGEKGDVDRQTNPKEKHAYHLQKSHSESDARDLDCMDPEKLAKLGYDVSKLNKVHHSAHAYHPTETPTRSSSEGGESPILHKSSSVPSSQMFESVQVVKQGAPRKSSIMKKIGGMFLRKNSLVDQDCIIHEEKTKKRISDLHPSKFHFLLKDKKKGKLKHQDSTDSTRISDISTSSTESSTSTDNQLLSPEQAFAMGEEIVEENDEKIYLRTSKKQKHPLRRKSKRLVHAEKDQLRIIDLPVRTREQLSDVKNG